MKCPILVFWHDTTLTFQKMHLNVALALFTGTSLAKLSNKSQCGCDN